MLPQHLIESDRLGKRTRIAVHDEALGRIVEVEAFGHHVINQIIGDELALFDVGMSAQSSGCLLANGFAENVAGADMLQAVALTEQLGLSSLTASGRTEKYETQGWAGSASQPALIGRAGHS